MVTKVLKSGLIYRYPPFSKAEEAEFYSWANRAPRAILRGAKQMAKTVASSSSLPVGSTAKGEQK